MINLAGHKGADEVIERELTRCGIKVVRAAQSSGCEVDTRISGFYRINKFEFSFTRAWCYWIVNGKVPLARAELLYKDVVGKTDIRVDGHCACPSPTKYATYHDEAGLKLVVDPECKQQTDFARLMAPSENNSDACNQILTEGFNKIHWCVSEEERDALTKESFIDLYHIDSELGLYIFMQNIKNMYR